jgi:Fungal specific transcription factor domain
MYDKSTRKRGLQSGYVRSLEIMLGLLFRHFPRSEGQLQDILRSHYGKDKLLEQDTPEFFSFWRSSSLARDIDRLLESSGRTTATGDGPSRDITRSPVEELELEVTTSHHTSEADDFHNVPIDAQAAEIPELLEQIQPLIIALPKDLCHEELPESTADLVEFYFSSVHCWFPIIKRSDILKAMHTTLPKNEKPSHRDIGLETCLWAIVAYGLANRNLADINRSSLRIQTLIRTRVIADDQSFEIGHIQAILILVLLRIAWGHLHAAWILVGQAARMILTYGERRSESIDRYYHALGGCALLDSALSALLKKRPCLSSNDIIFSETDLNDDSLDEWQMWAPPASVPGIRTRSVRKQPLRALSTLHRILELIQQLNRSLEGSRDSKSAQDFVQNLQSWRSKLPEYLLLSESVQSNPPVLHLHLTWHLVTCTHVMNSGIAGVYLTELVLNSVKSTQKLIHQYIDLAGLEGCSPLLSCYATLAKQCLHQIGQMNGQVFDLQQEKELTEMLNRLMDQWHTDDEKRSCIDGLNRPENQPENMNQLCTLSTDDYANRGATLQQHQQISGPFNMTEPFNLNATRSDETRTENYKGSVENKGKYPTNQESEETLGDGCNWDAWFEDMTPIAPATRYVKGNNILP